MTIADPILQRPRDCPRTTSSGSSGAPPDGKKRLQTIKSRGSALYGKHAASAVYPAKCPRSRSLAFSRRAHREASLSVHPCAYRSALPLAACTQTAVRPPASDSVTASGFRMPDGAGCQGEIDRYRAIMTNDLAMGHVTIGLWPGRDRKSSGPGRLHGRSRCGGRADGRRHESGATVIADRRTSAKNDCRKSGIAPGSISSSPRTIRTS